jgi:hypothetical protein
VRRRRCARDEHEDEFAPVVTTDVADAGDDCDFLCLRVYYLVAGELALTFRQIRDNFVINLHRSLILFGSNRNWST